LPSMIRNKSMELLLSLLSLANVRSFPQPRCVEGGPTELGKDYDEGEH
jgi:hypothetical protein